MPVDWEEYMGDSDEANKDDSIHSVQLTTGEESRAPSRSVHTNVENIDVKVEVHGTEDSYGKNLLICQCQMPKFRTPLMRST